MSDMELNYKTSNEGELIIHDVLWTVPEFIKLLAKKSTREFRTDELCPDLVIDCRFQLKMRFMGHDNDVIEFFYLSPNSVFLKSNLTLLLNGFRTLINNIKERSLVTEQYHTIQGNKWQYIAKFIKQEMTNNLENYICSDSLKLKFQFMFFHIKVDNFNVSESQMVGYDFEDLLNFGFSSDVTMKSAEGNEYKVHKDVISSRSAVLKAQFEHNKCHNDIVESPLETEVLIEVLTFMYSGKAPRVDEIPDLLLDAADYYQLVGLKSLCEEVLCKRLTVDSAVETLHLAILHSADRLKQITLAFIKDGQSILIMQTEGWAKVKSIKVIKTIYEYILSDDIVADSKADT